MTRERSSISTRSPDTRVTRPPRERDADGVLTPAELDRMFDEIVAACREKQAAGYKVRRYSFGSEESRTCCAVSACGEFDRSDLRDNPLGVTGPEAWAIAFGFDGSSNTDEAHKYPGAFDLGRRVARELGLP